MRRQHNMTINTVTYSKKSEKLTFQDLPYGAIYSYPNDSDRPFMKINTTEDRYNCVCLTSGQRYIESHTAIVEPLYNIPITIVCNAK